MNPLKHLAIAWFVGLTSLPTLVAAQTAIDGRWKSKDSDEIVTFKTLDGRVTMAASTGAGYTAKLDGSEAEVQGDKAVDTVSVTMPDPHTLVETNKKNGQAWLRFRMQVDASGKNAKVSWTNLKTGKSGGYEMTLQQARGAGTAQSPVAMTVTRSGYHGLDVFEVDVHKAGDVDEVADTADDLQWVC